MSDRSPIVERAEQALHALHLLEDELEQRPALTEYELAIVERVRRRWQHDTTPKIDRARRRGWTL